MSYETLKSLGVKNIENIERYSLRSEIDQDILKVYFHKQKGDLFHRSEKFKFARVHRAVRDDRQHGDYNTALNEVSPILIKMMAELDKIVTHEKTERDIKQKILSDLRHLEKVVANKVAEIEADLEKL